MPLGRLSDPRLHLRSGRGGVPHAFTIMFIPNKASMLSALFTRREAITAATLFVIILAISGLLVAPILTQVDVTTTPPTPEELVDSDADGVPDVVEVFVYGSDPSLSDTSGDGVPDGWKAEHARWDEMFRLWRPDPVRNDSSERLVPGALTIARAYEHGTDPHIPDTSGDGFPDAWLVASGLDPHKQHDPGHVCASDGMTLEEKSERGLLGCAEDSSGNGLPDVAAMAGEWVVEGRTITFEPTNPANWSTGGSGAPDGWLLRLRLDPHDPSHATADPDGDALSTLQEWQFSREHCGLAEALEGCGLDPTTGDTDGDGVTDGWEVRTGLDPLDPGDASEDPDEDGLSSGREFEHGTDPLSADTDGDTLQDGREIEGWTIQLDGEETTVKSNPLVADTDGDGLDDAEESKGEATLDGRLVSFPATNPLSADTDADGLSDRHELLALPPPQRLDPTTSDTSGSGLLDGEEWDLWVGKAERGGVDAEYAGLVANERGVPGSEVPGLLAPGGDLDGDGEVNVLDPDTDGDGQRDGEEVHPGSRDGRQLPSSDPALEDSDGDDLPDAWELQHTQYSNAVGGWLLDPLKLDSDGDGIPDGDEDGETECFSDPELAGDGIPWMDTGFPNRLELEYGTNPLECDTDEDGLPDGWEVFSSQDLQEAGIPLSLNPLIADSAGDGVRDGDRVSPISDRGEGRVQMEQDPRCPATGGKVACLWRWGTAEELLSTTFSGLGDLLEFRGPCQTDARCTVVLALNLSTEVSLRTDPATWDTSGDGFPDVWKVFHQFDPSDATVPDPGGDPDGDGLANSREYLEGTDPREEDTDNGGVADGVDIDPLDPTDDRGDCDWDGIDDREEAGSGGTQAGTSDTPGDGLLDGTYNPGGCVTADGPRRPVPGVDIVAVPGETEEGRFTLLGSRDTGADPSTWDTAGDGLPDGWKSRYDLNPLVPSIPQDDEDGDGIPLLAEYQLGRPSWWDERLHGSWWFGSNPLSVSTRDLDGDGLDDTFFDPEPLSPTNDCRLPETWAPPPAWQELSRRFCVETPPSTSELDAFLTGLRQLAYHHVLNVTSNPEEERLVSGSSSRTTVRVSGFEADATLDTARPFNVSVELCSPEGDACTQPQDLTPPLVGIYASNRSDGERPDPRNDVLLCILPADSTWTASGTCSLEPGQRSAPRDASTLILGPHRHGFVEPSQPWAVDAGDIQPGRTLRLTAWPLPTKSGTLLVPEVDLSTHPPPETRRTPAAQAVIELPAIPQLERGEPQTVTIRLTDLVGHPLENHRVEAVWDGESMGTQRTDAGGTLVLELDPGSPEEPKLAWLNLTVPTIGGVQGASQSFELPIRVPTRLDAQADAGRIPGGLTLDTSLRDHRARPVANATIEAQVVLLGGSTAKGAGTTDINGNTTLHVPLPGDGQPGQAPIEVRFVGNAQWAPSQWSGTAQIHVQPTLSLSVPDRILVTDGGKVDVAVLTPSGDPLVPAPGDPVRVSISLPGIQREQILNAPPPGGNVTLPIPTDVQLRLGDQELRASASSERFVEPVTETRRTRVVTPVTVHVSPTTLGAGADNVLMVSVRDAYGRSLPDVPVSVELGDARATGTTEASGEARVNLPLASHVERGEHLLRVSAGSTNASLPLDEEVPVQILLGAVIEVPRTVNGSVEAIELTGRLTTSAGEPMASADVTVEAFGVHDLRTDNGGRFNLEISPPQGTAPGRYEARVSYDGDEGLAPAVAWLDLVLAVPTNIEVHEVPTGTVNSSVRVAGLVLAGEDPVEGGQVTIHLLDLKRSVPVGNDGRFEVVIPLQDAPAGNKTARLTYDPVPGYGPSEATVSVTLVHEILLHVDHRATRDGIHVSVQAVRADGTPVPDAGIVIGIPGSPLIVQTDADGVARADFGAGVLPPGSEIALTYRGGETHASAQVMMEVPSLPSTPPQTTVLGALLAALVGLEVVVLWRALRRRRVIEEMLKAVEELEHRMVAGDESRAIVLAAYQKIRAILEAAGWEQTPQQTHREFLTGALDTLGVRTSHLAPFVELVDRAQYDPAPFDAHYRAQAHHLAILLGKVLRARLGRREAAG